MTCDACKFLQSCRKIVGVGINYKKVLAEKGLTKPYEPAIFLKPTSSLIGENQPIKIPKGLHVHCEIELGVVIGKLCKNVEPCRIDEYIGSYCLTLDLTADNLLRRAQRVGYPWALAKSFDTACAVSSTFIDPGQILCPRNIDLWLSINGCLRTAGSTCDMIFPTDILISYISRFMTLEPYDLILTGTPGSEVIHPGEKIIAGLGKQLVMEFDVCNYA